MNLHRQYRQYMQTGHYNAGRQHRQAGRQADPECAGRPSVRP